MELERLLPPDKFSKHTGHDEGLHLEFRHVDGATFLAPASGGKERKITHICKWEQAFRVYALIYCRANPHRMKEIWQYIDVINTAATTYVWDNVAKYDYTFRQLMAFNPNRSWSTIYNHMWNLVMTEPINRGGNAAVRYDKDKHRKSLGSSGKRDISDYCWSFNRGHCKYGSNCDFINRCNYCDSTSHGENSCYKLAAKRAGKEGKDNHRGWKDKKRSHSPAKEKSDK